MDRATTKAPTSETPSTSRMSAPLMMASRFNSSRSSRALPSMSLRRVSSMVFIAWILLELWSYQSKYERRAEPVMAVGLSSTFCA